MECIKCEHTFKIGLLRCKISKCGSNDDLVIRVICPKCRAIHQILYQQTMIVNVEKE